MQSELKSKTADRKPHQWTNKDNKLNKRNKRTNKQMKQAKLKADDRGVPSTEVEHILAAVR